MERDDDEEDANFLLICQEFTGVMDEVIVDQTVFVLRIIASALTHGREST